MRLKVIHTLFFALAPLLTLAEVDPFSGGDDKAHAPRHARVQVRLIEISHTDLVDAMDAIDSSDGSLYSEVQKLKKKGKAKLVHLAIVTARSGEKSSVESLREMIFPTEYEHPSFPDSPKMVEQQGKQRWKHHPIRPYGAPPVAFETRNVGDTLEIEPSISSDGKIIDLRLSYDRVSHLRDIVWLTHKDRWGEANLFFPEFGTWRPMVALSLLNNQMQFVTSFTLQNQGRLQPNNRRVLLFAKVRVIQP